MTAKLTLSEVQASLHAYVEIVRAIADALRELGSVPAGHFYAQVCQHLTLSQYERVIDTLKGAGLVAESGHVLTWTGRQIDEAIKNKMDHT
jgi:hypothetical protein